MSVFQMAAAGKIVGLFNDSVYWNLRRNYGGTSEEVRRYLLRCAEYQGLVPTKSAPKRRTR